MKLKIDKQFGEQVDSGGFVDGPWHRLPSGQIVELIEQDSDYPRGNLFCRAHLADGRPVFAWMDRDELAE